MSLHALTLRMKVMPMSARTIADAAMPAEDRAEMQASSKPYRAEFSGKCCRAVQLPRFGELTTGAPANRSPVKAQRSSSAIMRWP